MQEPAKRESYLSSRLRFLGMCFAVFLLVFVSPSRGAIPLSLDNPTDFFTNIATRLVKSELGLDLSNLQVYPTNFYTPSVHRLLQVAANIYDSTTNRTLGITPEYPYCPSVFRPLFRQVAIGTNSIIVIAGYREVTDAELADPNLAPAMVDLSEPNASLQVFPPYGTVFMWPEKVEPMVSGIPLIIGAKEGFPNFNEFSMQTQVFVSRLLEFVREPGDPNTRPVIETNQMYVVGISNLFGLEAWNSYSNAYPRNLQLVASVYMTAVLTNENGAANVLFSNTTVQGHSLLVPSNSWSGWTTSQSVPASMLLPFGGTNGVVFLANSTYLNTPPYFMPATHIFTRNEGFYIPHWWLNLRTRILFVLVDTTAHRIVDYVNLNHEEPTVDITYTLASGNTNPSDYHNPANQWITNRLDNSSSPSVATYGILNQIQIGLNGTTDWSDFVQDRYAGLDLYKAVDGFRYNFGFSPIFPEDLGITFYRSNVFYAPFDPFRTVYVHTDWQANDPLVHYTIDDLVDPLTFYDTNRITLISQGVQNVGQINTRYRPWSSGTGVAPDPLTDFDVSVKDPNVNRSDDWDFPTNKCPNIGWLGRVHRGTPWQTIFLKSTNYMQKVGGPKGFAQSLLYWAKWTGNPVVWSDGNHSGIPMLDAFFTTPTNDWHLVSLLNNFFNTNDVHGLASPNLATIQTWESLLDGITAFTNSGSGQVTPIVISSNSPQAALVAGGLLSTREAQPNQTFQNVGDVLATPELSVASPFVLPGSFSTTTDDVLEAIPSQLLSRLRPDSIGRAAPEIAPNEIQFTGMDGYSYAIETSSNLLNWTAMSTNVPQNGVLNFVPSSIESPQFFRSVLRP